MDLSYGPRYLALREEVRDFIKQYGDQSPRTGGGRKRPDKRALDWQRLLLVDTSRAPFPRSTAASAFR
jgi:hypothetical protein